MELEGASEVEHALIDFYRDVALLALVDEEAAVPRRLRFRTGRIELRYSIVPSPHVSPVACRLLVAVPLLREAKVALDERSVPYEFLRGVNYTDRRLSLLDPAGNRIELAQYWPESF